MTYTLCFGRLVFLGRNHELDQVLSEAVTVQYFKRVFFYFLFIFNILLSLLIDSLIK